MSTGTPSQSACMFCSQDTGKLHACLTTNLDYDLRQMATELQDTELPARISGGDLVAIEAKTILNVCLHIKVSIVVFNELNQVITLAMK